MRHCPGCGVYVHGVDAVHAESCEWVDGPASVRESFAQGEWRDARPTLRVLVGGGEDSWRRQSLNDVTIAPGLCTPYPDENRVQRAKRREQVPPTRGRVTLADTLARLVKDCTDELHTVDITNPSWGLRGQILETLRIAHALELYRIRESTQSGGTPA